MNLNSISGVLHRTLTVMERRAPPRSVEAIADRLIATRLALGLNQRQLCERAGLATNTYNQWEKAKGRPDLDGALVLCDTFGLSLDWIYRGDESRLPHDIAMRLRTPDTEPPTALKRGRG